MPLFKKIIASALLSTTFAFCADINSTILHAQKLHDSGDFKASADLYRTLLINSPEKNSSDIRYALALNLHLAGENQKVIDLLAPADKSWKEVVMLSNAYETVGDLEKSIHLLEGYAKVDDPLKASLARKYLALAYFNQNTLQSKQHALEIMEAIISQPNYINEESYYLYGSMAWDIYKKNPDKYYATLAETAWKKETTLFPTSPYTLKALLGLGALYFHKGDYPSSKKIFLLLLEQFPESPQKGDIFYYIALNKEKLNESPDQIQTLRRKVYQQYPSSTHAAEAYLTTYPYGQYFIGNVTALKHLQEMSSLFPDSPFLVQAYYFLGLDLKKDRRNTEGQIIRPRDLHAAIDAFQNAETTFETIQHKGLDNPHYFTSVYYRCTLERALCNLLIAQGSMGSKKQIYHEYGVEVLNQIINDFSQPQHLLAQHIFKEEPYPSLYADAQFALALALTKNQQEKDAENVFDQMLENYRKHQITRGYLLSRIWFEKGAIKQHHDNFDLALNDYQKAEECAKGNVLSDDQKLDLWIQQSLCQSALNKLDDAMLTLSKVINEDAISGLRLKAMYLRAEIYKKQGRDELAQKQLEALSTKNGEWAQKAKQKLEEEYAF